MGELPATAARVSPHLQPGLIRQIPSRGLATIPTGMRKEKGTFGGLVPLLISSLSLAACGTAETEEQPGPSAGGSAAVAETADLPVRAPQVRSM